jgi:hypothetical protein
MAATEHKANVRESSIGHFGETFGLDFEDRFTLELADRHVVFGQQIILSFIFTQLKHGSVLEFHNISNLKFISNKARKGTKNFAHTQTCARFC